MCAKTRTASRVAPSLIHKATLLFGSILFTLIFLELTIRFLGLYPHRPSQDETLFEYNEIYGWQFIPGKSAMEVAPGEFEGWVTINSTGMRDEEYSVKKPDGKKRIAVLGDSFVANLDVENADVFTERMKKLLPSDWQVLNFGVNGFGPTQELLMLRNKVIHYEPDMVIMLIYSRNDFDDIAGTMDWIKGYKRPKAILGGDGKVVIDPVLAQPPPPPESADRWRPSGGKEPLSFKKIHLRSLLYNYVRDRLFYRYNVFLMPEIRLCKKTPSRETEVSYILMKGILEEVRNFTRENGVGLIVVTAPTLVQVHDDVYWAKMKRKYGLDDERYDLFAPNKFIKQSCRDLGIRNLDLTPGLRQYASGGEILYYPHNQHWNKRGNQLVAEIISDYLRENGLVPSRINDKYQSTNDK